MYAFTLGGRRGHIPHLDGWVGEGYKEDNHVHVTSDFQAKGYTFTYAYLFNVDHYLIILVNFQ